MASASNLKSQIASMQRRLSKMELGETSSIPKPNKSQRRRRRRERQTLGVVGPAVQQINPRGPRRQRNKLLTEEGSIRMTRREYVMDVIGNSTSFFELSPVRLPWLKGLSQIFDRYKWINVVMEYKPAVGTTTDGLLAMGVDWESKNSTYDRSVIMCLTPLVEMPVWQAGVMPLPKNRLQTRKEYRIHGSQVGEETFDTMPGIGCYSCTGKGGVKGEIWLHYTIELFGTAKG